MRSTQTLINAHDLYGLQCREHRQDLAHQGQRMMQLSTFGMKDDDSDIVRRRVLLEAQVAIAGPEDIEFFFRLGEQRPIRESTPPDLLRGYCVVSSECARQPPVEALVNQNAHRSDGFE